MGSSIQQYCLRWNNHRSNLLLVFEHLFQTEAFTDVTLACDGESIKCHKMVLAACSSYFQQLFMENTCRHPIVILKDIRESEIRAILEYMYKGEVNVAQDQLAGLLKAAETLKVKGLVEDNNQRVSSTPTPTPPQQSSSPYHHQPPQAPLPPTPLSSTTASTAAIQHEERLYYSSLGSTNSPYPTSTTKPNCLSSSSKFIANDSPSSLYDSPYSHNVINSTTGSSATPERNALPFPASWPSKNLSPKHGILGGSGNIANSSNTSNVIQSTTNANNNNTISNTFEREQSEPVPLKKKRFMMSAAASSSSSIINAANKDTPILRTVLGHTGCLSAPNSSVIQQDSHLKSLNYSFTPTITTTNGPIDTNDLRLERERERERDRDRDRERESPIDSYMEDTMRSLDSDKGHDDNHPFNLESDEKKGMSGLAMYVPSQKPEWKRYKQYTRNDILAAIDAVKDGMSALQAARKFGVPSRTLYDKVKKLGITTNRPYRKGSFPMSPYHGMNIKDDNSSFSPEEPLDISSTGNGLGHDMSIHGHEGDSDKMDSDPGSSSVKRETPPLDFKDDYIREDRERPENGSGKCSSTPPREREPMEAEEIVRSHSE